MTITHVLGIFALAAGGSLLVSEPMLGPDLFAEVTGLHVTALYPLCAVNLAAGALILSASGPFWFWRRRRNVM